ncbi:VIT1/CCC1 transporter family protein [Undibacterium sp. Dicai25W]|uniref:VIT1/CCC1 transporter family protein n=1 Tax=Undibacterium sp. Dicai25W TaxID=3413034 RepID=UPI003BF29DB7
MTTHTHRTHRSGWLRAAVLGANDGLLSISSLLLGVAAAHISPDSLIVAGFAGLIGGALSMGAGEYVSVSSQADVEQADLDIERHALRHEYDAEHAELRDIYIDRGVDHEIASLVAQQLMEKDALGAYARDEIGITDALSARPSQAAVASSLSFMAGGIIPLGASLLAPTGYLILTIAAVSLFFLALLGGLAAYSGGASLLRGAGRVLFWGALVLTFTAMAGKIFGTTI